MSPPLALELPTADVFIALRRLLDLVISCRDQLRDLSKSNDEVGGWLYANWYLIPHPREDVPPIERGREFLASFLRGALPASRRWQQGWVVMQSTPNGSCLAGHRDRRRELRPGDYANSSRPAMPVMPGDRIAVIECVDWVDVQTGFWCAHPIDQELRPPLVRLYLSVNHNRVQSVLAKVAALLDENKVRYSLKCPANAVDFERVDSLIFYLERTEWHKAQSAIKGVAVELASALRQSTPPLTLRLAPGIAFADDPGDGQSFGKSRCDALAPAAAELMHDEGFEEAMGMATLVRSLLTAGIDPVQPWLNGIK